jgi:hypothetical protein
LRKLVAILRVSAAKLDDAYLDAWAARLRCQDLLSRAREEASGA